MLLQFSGIPTKALQGCWRKAKKAGAPTGVMDAEEFGALCGHVVSAGGNPLNTRIPLPTELPHLSVEKGKAASAEAEAEKDEFV